MDRPETITFRRRGRAQGATTAAAAVALTASALATPAPAAHAAEDRLDRSAYIVEVASAQTGGYRARGNTSLPDAARPVMLRMSTMLQAAEARRTNAPYAARQSYQAAASAFRQALATGRMSANTGGGGATLAAGAGTAGLPVSSTQVAEDIRTLKAAMTGATAAQRDALQRVTSLYATGAKEFFTGQLRDALFSTDNTTGGAIVIRGQRRPSNTTDGAGFGTASSALTTGRTVTPRGAQTTGGVVQSNGAVVPVESAPSVPSVPASAAPPGSNIVPGGVNVTETPPIGVTPVVPGAAVSPLSPTAPVVVPAPTAPVVAPAPPTAPVPPSP